MKRFCMAVIPFVATILASGNLGRPAVAAQEMAEKIVFLSTTPNGKNVGVAVMNADGSHRITLTENEHDEVAPALSPDGKRIAVVRDGDSVWVMNLDGSGRKQVAHSFNSLRAPSWSPDGKRIAYFVRKRSGFSVSFGDLRVVDADGGNTRTLLEGLCFGFGGPFSAWSPNGKQILHAGNGTLEAVGLDDKKNRHLGKGWRPVWSPDGKTILYTAQEKQDDQEVYLYMMGADGKTPRRLTKSLALFGAWSPDGKRVAYVSMTPVKDSAALSDLSVCSVDGSDPTRLTKSGDVQLVRWSADGKRIFFNRMIVDKHKLIICVIDADGKNEKELSKGDRPDLLEGDGSWLMKDFLSGEELPKKEVARKKEPTREEAARMDVEALQGAWRFVRSEQGALDDTWEVEGQRVAFEKDAFTLKKGDKVVLRGTFKLDISKRPRTIDITITEGGHKGKTMLGIWEIDREGLRWCVSEPGAKDRPTAFATNKGSSDRRSSFEKHKP